MQQIKQLTIAAMLGQCLLDWGLSSSSMCSSSQDLHDYIQAAVMPEICIQNQSINYRVSRSRTARVGNSWHWALPFCYKLLHECFAECTHIGLCIIIISMQSNISNQARYSDADNCGTCHNRLHTIQVNVLLWLALIDHLIDRVPRSHFIWSRHFEALFQNEF
jgi:hypothetical protein